MGYVVYVNHPVSKAMIHDEKCTCYRNRKADQTPDGFWEDIFESYEEALQFAKSTGKRYIGSCTFCISRNLKLACKKRNNKEERNR